MSGEMDLLKGVYDRFNARDTETLLAAMQEDVIWANGMEGGHVHGREEVRKYWSHQWAMIDPHVEPVEFAKGPGGEVVVEVHQVVRDLNGTPSRGRWSVTCFELKMAWSSALISATPNAPSPLH